jgi:type II secretion system protein I
MGKGIKGLMKRRIERGFTLLEVMVAITIFSVFFTTILSLLSDTIRLSISAKEHTLGYLLAQSKLEEILLGMEEGVQGEFQDAEKFEWEMLTEPTQSANVDKIKVRVFWQDRKKCTEIETFKFVGERNE